MATAEAVGAAMPIQVTLDDLAKMAAADDNHRYELSSDGVLQVSPPGDPDHALLVSRIAAWFLTNGYGADQVVMDCGIDVGGGRVPDLTLWAKGTPPRPGRSGYASIAGLQLAVEVVFPGSEVTDRVIKMAEYAKAGIPRYWVVERDSGTTVHRHILANGAAEYAPEHGGPQALVWILATVPEIS